MLRIFSQNCNGLRARIRYGFEKTIDELKPEVICLSEVRANASQIPKTFLPDYEKYFSVHNTPGYAGAAIFVRSDIPKPLFILDDFPENDEPGRVCIADFKYFKLISAYVPNSGGKLEKLDNRMAWQDKLHKYVQNVSQLKPVIYTGDLNCAPTKFDTACPTVRAGCSSRERQAFKDLLDLGMKDVYRELRPNEHGYTWYSNTYDSRAAGNGMRIDHFIISNELMGGVHDCNVINDDKFICKSDHNPIVLDIDLKLD